MVCSSQQNWAAECWLASLSPGLRLGLQWQWTAGPGQQWQPAHPMQSGRPARHPCPAGTSPGGRGAVHQSRVSSCTFSCWDASAEVKGKPSPELRSSGRCCVYGPGVCCPGNVGFTPFLSCSVLDNIYTNSFKNLHASWPVVSLLLENCPKEPKKETLIKLVKSQ